jgi:hypothetical protein
MPSSPLIAVRPRSAEPTVQLGHGGHPLDCLEHRRRANRAVDAKHRRAPPFQFGRKPLRRSTVQRITVLLRRHLRDDRQIGHAAHGVDRRAYLVQVAERLQHKQIDAAVDEGLGLLAEYSRAWSMPRLAPRFDPDAKRADRARDVGAVARGRAREPGAFRVDGVELVGNPERAELDAVGPEGIGFDDVRARADVPGAPRPPAGALRLSASKLLLMKTPLAQHRAIAPSQTRTTGV